MVHPITPSVNPEARSARIVRRAFSLSRRYAQQTGRHLPCHIALEQARKEEDEMQLTLTCPTTGESFRYEARRDGDVQTVRGVVFVQVRCPCCTAEEVPVGTPGSGPQVHVYVERDGAWVYGGQE
jgi:hypothetical protein